MHPEEAADVARRVAAMFNAAADAHDDLLVAVVRYIIVRLHGRRQTFRLFMMVLIWTKHIQCVVRIGRVLPRE